jgi:hypothetical protein
MVGYTWPEVAGVLGDRELQVTVTALPGSVTGVLAESQSDWVVPRPSTERIPGSVREIDIIARKPGRSPYLVHVTDGGEVRYMVGLFNSMPIVQPVTINCPALLGGGQVLTFTFRNRRGGPSQAEASFTEFPNLSAWSGPCTPVELRIGGRRQQSLAGGHFITHATRSSASA